MFGRDRFQLHLSTIVLLTLAAGVLLGTNCYPHHSEELNGAAYGFPFPMYQNWTPRLPEQKFTGLTFSHSTFVKVGSWQVEFSPTGWSIPLLACNVVIGLLTLLIFGVSLEWLARRTAKE